MKQETIDKAVSMGFIVSDKLSYRLETDTGLDNGKQVFFWNVKFPNDYPYQKPQSVFDDSGLSALIRQYNNRFEDAKKDTEFSVNTIKGIEWLSDKFNSR